MSGLILLCIFIELVMAFLTSWQVRYGNNVVWAHVLYAISVCFVGTGLTLMARDAFGLATGGKIPAIVVGGVIVAQIVGLLVGRWAKRMYPCQ